mgnify:CR=1 FL=1
MTFRYQTIESRKREVALTARPKYALIWGMEPKLKLENRLKTELMKARFKEGAVLTAKEAGYRWRGSGGLCFFTPEDRTNAAAILGKSLHFQPSLKDLSHGASGRLY